METHEQIYNHSIENAKCLFLGVLPHAGYDKHDVHWYYIHIENILANLMHSIEIDQCCTMLAMTTLLNLEHDS